jgi:hypothetical protein
MDCGQSVGDSSVDISLPRQTLYQPCLFHVGGDAVEGGANLRPQCLRGNENANAGESCDEAIFDAHSSFIVRKISDIMTPSPFSIEPHTTLDIRSSCARCDNRRK